MTIKAIDILRISLVGFVHTKREPVFRSIDRARGLRIATEVIAQYEVGAQSITLCLEGIEQVSLPFLEGSIGKIMTYLHTNGRRVFAIEHTKQAWHPLIEQVLHKALSNFVRLKK